MTRGAREPGDHLLRDVYYEELKSIEFTLLTGEKPTWKSPVLEWKPPYEIDLFPDQWVVWEQIDLPKKAKHPGYAVLNSKRGFKYICPTREKAEELRRKMVRLFEVTGSL